MSKKDMKKEMQALHDQGQHKMDIFNEFKGKGLKEKELAQIVAQLKDRTLCALYETKNNILITLIFIQTFFVAFASYQIAIQSNFSPYVFAAVGASIGLLFIYGFYRFSPVAYQVFILLTIIRLPREIEPLSKGGAVELIAFVVSMCIFIYVWYLKSKLYPDLGLFGAKKSNGVYNFSS